jgi:hypothetical protein
MVCWNAASASTFRRRCVYEQGWLGLLSNDYFAVLDDFRDADFCQARIGILKLIHLSKTAFSCTFRFDDGSDALATTWTGVDQPELT